MPSSSLELSRPENEARVDRFGGSMTIYFDGRYQLRAVKHFKFLMMAADFKCGWHKTVTGLVLVVTQMQRDVVYKYR